MNGYGSEGCGCAATSVMTPADGDAAAVDLRRSRYRIGNMGRPAGETFICNKLATLPGVVNFEFSLIQRSLTVQHRLSSLAPVEQALAAVGM